MKPFFIAVRKSFLYRLFTTFYHKTEHWKGKKRAEQALKLEVHLKNLKLCSEYFPDFMVTDGPFKGLKYIENSSGSTLLPKILGSYEEPIHDWIRDVQKEAYVAIVDVGCAEGYYAVGFATSRHKPKVFAFDIDPTARQRTAELAKLNAVEENIVISDKCEHTDLSRLLANAPKSSRVLVFCDIEGAEEELLDPSCVPELADADIIVESHDCFVPGITDVLTRRFWNTHRIEIAVDYSARIHHYPALDQVNREDAEWILDERRAVAMKFLRMTPLHFLQANTSE